MTEISASQLTTSDANSQTIDPTLEALSQCQLTYVCYAGLFDLLRSGGKARLQQYLKQGGVLLIEAEAGLKEMERLQHDIQGALTDLEGIEGSEKDEAFSELRSRLNTTLTQLNTCMAQDITTIVHQTKSFAEQLDYPLTGEGAVGQMHPLRQMPFSFSHWPPNPQNPIRLFCWNGIVLAIGPLSALWAPEATAKRSLQENRMAEEWGLNLLHYAWKHHQMTQLQQESQQEIKTHE